jgi:4-hydroxybenzoate polyprenyltransferase
MIFVFTGFACFILGGFLVHPVLGLFILGIVLFVFGFALQSIMKEEKEKKNRKLDST